VWGDIDPGDTLQYRAARDHQDERHIAPLQLGVIRRCIDLWSNPGDVVLTPFAGIGSEVYVAAEMERRGLGIELKPSYFAQAVKNLTAMQAKSEDLFKQMGAAA
jgi:DNA modification methylase